MDVKPIYKVLYITYDGLTDPLGQSQILPYLKGLSPSGYQFTILSFEKKDRFDKQKRSIDKLIAESGIEWIPLSFTSTPPLLSKFYDAVRMKNKAFELQKTHHFDMVHCRSYVAAEVGSQLKKKFGTKFFFDMRGFWADEKKDGSWNMKNPVFKKIYSYYKSREAEYLREADYIISLTEAGKNEMMKWPSYNKATPLEIIPCCADMDHFTVTSAEAKRKARRDLKIDDDSFVLSYLGSVGTWYMLDEMLLFFRELKEKYPKAKFLFLTHSDLRLIYSKAKSLGLDTTDLLVREASREDVPKFMKASDINISFIKPVYSKMSSSPTKMGEVLSMGIPMIVNSGIGDVESIIEYTNGGYVINQFSAEAYREAIEFFPELIKRDPQKIRHRAEHIYSLQRGIDLYQKCYDELLPLHDKIIHS
jgi:glycosyltransferase involved in cell wall biosynthesis